MPSNSTEWQRPWWLSFLDRVRNQTVLAVGPGMLADYHSDQLHCRRPNGVGHSSDSLGGHSLLCRRGSGVLIVREGPQARDTTAAARVGQEKNLWVRVSPFSFLPWVSSDQPVACRRPTRPLSLTTRPSSRSRASTSRYTRPFLRERWRAL
jgi:hypothetical protein